MQSLTSERLDVLWLATLQQLVDRVAHEIKDSLNGVSLNLEVIRSRSGKADVDAGSLGGFAGAAAEQMELLSARTESLLFLCRPQHRQGGVDVALTLKHFRTLLVPAARADGGLLTIDGWERATPTSAPAQTVRLALAAPLLDLVKRRGSGHCVLGTGSGTVVRFSHESAAACTLDPAITEAVAEHGIETRRSDQDLLMVFPGS